jgi:hypothetical protein
MATGNILSVHVLIVATQYEKFRQTLQLCLNNFRESGTIGRKERSGQLTKRTQEVIENVQQIMDNSAFVFLLELVIKF